MTADQADPFAQFRGEFPRASVSARQVANTLTTPACERRRLLDMAEIDTRRLGMLVNDEDGKISSFAITRARTFTTRVTENNLAVVIALAREHLGIDQRDVRQVNLDPASVKDETPTLQPEQVTERRLRRTRAIVEEILGGTRQAMNLVRNPLTTLALGERTVHLEHDLMLFASTTNSIHLVEIRDYPEIDGVIEPSKAGQTKREAAVALISMQQMVATLGGDPGIISSKFLLITPKQLMLVPVARVVDAAPQMTRLRMLIERTPKIEDLADTLASLPPLPALPDDNPAARQQAQDQALAALAPLRYRLGQGCSSCVLHRKCRDQATRDNQIQVLGPHAAQTCGSVESVNHALDLAHGIQAPTDPSETAVAVALDRARRSIEFALQVVANEDTDTLTHPDAVGPAAKTATGTAPDDDGAGPLS